MNIKRFILGALGVNAYLCWENNKAVIFDLGGSNYSEIINFIKENSLELKMVILTHGHYDHIGGINSLYKDNKDFKVVVGKEDKVFLEDKNFNLSTFIDGSNFSVDKSIEILEVSEGDEVFGFKVIDTPGHTAGGKTYYNELNNFMITGDTLFQGSYGRTDFPTGNIEVLFESLKKLFNNYNGDVICYPGHGEKTDLKTENRNIFQDSYIY